MTSLELLEELYAIGTFTMPSAVECNPPPTASIVQRRYRTLGAVATAVSALRKAQIAANNRSNQSGPVRQNSASLLPGFGDKKRGFTLPPVQYDRTRKILEKRHQQMVEKANNTTMTSGEQQMNALRFRRRETLAKARTEEAARLTVPKSVALTYMMTEVRDTLKREAIVSLRLLLYPRLVLRSRMQLRNSIVKMAEINASRFSPDALKKIQLFANFPQQAINFIISKLKLQCYDRGEYIAYQDEQSCGVIFVQTGTVVVLSKSEDKKKGYDTDDRGARTAGPGSCFGELTPLTDERRSEALRAQTPCEIWILPSEKFIAALQLVPQEVTTQVVSHSFYHRNANLEERAPLEVADLARQKIFSVCPEQLQSDFVRRMKPFCVPKDFFLFEAGQPATAMYFLKTGRCAAVRIVNGEPTEVAWLSPGSVVADVSVLHSAPFSDTIKTLTPCEFWVLTKSNFEFAVRLYPEIVQEMLAASRSQREMELLSQQMQFRGYVHQFPILRDILEREQMKELVQLFEPRVYKSMHVLCSTATFCDRVILLLKGTVRVGDNDHWHVGEMGGFTCIVPHRWGQTALTMDLTETLELSYRTYCAFLRDVGAYKKLFNRTLELLFPKAFPPEVTYAAQDMVSYLKTPPMYPVSVSYKINLHEPGFSSEHIHFTHTDKEAVPLSAPKTLGKIRGRSQSLEDDSHRPVSPMASAQHHQHHGGSVIVRAHDESDRRDHQSGTKKDESSSTDDPSNPFFRKKKSKEAIVKNDKMKGMHRVSQFLWTKSDREEKSMKEVEEYARKMQKLLEERQRLTKRGKKAAR